MAEPFLHMDVLVRLRSPPDCLRGKVTGATAGESLTLSNVYSMSQGTWFPSVVVDSNNLLELTNAVDMAPPAAAAATAVPDAVPPAVHIAAAAPAVLGDPAIVSLGPRSARSSDQGTTAAAPALALRSRSLHASSANGSANNSRSSSIRSATRYAAGPAVAAEPGGAPKTRRRPKRQPYGENIVPEVANGRVDWAPSAERAPAGPPAPPASVCGRGRKAAGRQQQPPQQPPQQQRRSGSQKTVGHQQEAGWASEDATDVQETGDVDFEIGLARYDRRTLFDQTRREGPSDDGPRLATHSRRPAPPQPGTATESDTYLEDNADATELPPPQPRPVAVATDFWNSDADDTAATAERPSPRDLGSRQSSRRGDSKARRPQARKTSAAAHGQGPRRVHSVAPSARLAPPPSFCLVPSGRRVGSVSALQMLNLENIAQNELGLTEDMMTENAGRGIAEVALTALSDPAIKIRSGTASAAAAAATASRNNSNKRHNRHRRAAHGDGKGPAAPTVVILAGNSKSGMRAVAGGRHLQSRGVNVLVCVVGIERGERALLDGFRQQIRLFQNLGGRVLSKSALFAHLRQAALATPTPTPTATPTPTPTPPAVTLIVDALLGLAETFDELRTGDQATVYELMEWANRNEAFVLAVDVPSGLDPSTGAVSIIDGARLYVQPRYVVALGAPKRGLLEALAAADAADAAADGDEDDDDDDAMAGAAGPGPGPGPGPEPDAAAADATLLADDPARDWQLFVADMGLAAAVWRRGGLRQRQGGVDFGDRWVLPMKYAGRAADASG